MTLLLAREFEFGRYERLATLKATKTGRVTFPVKLQGTVWAAFARSAARQFAAEPAATSVKCEHGSHKARIERID